MNRKRYALVRTPSKEKEDPDDVSNNKNNNNSSDVTRSKDEKKKKKRKNRDRYVLIKRMDVNINIILQITSFFFSTYITDRRLQIRRKIKRKNRRRRRTKGNFSEFK